MPAHRRRPARTTVAPAAASAPPAPGRGVPLLEGLASELARAGRHGHVAHVGVAPCGDHEVDLHFFVPHRDVVAELVGWRPPAEWIAVGVLAPVASLDGPASFAVAEGPRRRAPGPTEAGCSVLVGRGGQTVVALAPGTSDGQPPHELHAADGAFVDLCRRALGLATPPCPVPPRRLWTAAWLDAVLALAVDRPPDAAPLRWPAMAALHPLRSLLPAAGPPGPDALSRLAGHPLAGASWAAVRRSLASGHLRMPGLSQAEAAWFDEGSLARWVLGAYPAIEQLLASVSDLLAPADGEAIRQVVAAWCPPGGASDPPARVEGGPGHPPG